MADLRSQWGKDRPPTGQFDGYSPQAQTPGFPPTPGGYHQFPQYGPPSGGPMSPQGSEFKTNAPKTEQTLIWISAWTLSAVRSRAPGSSRSSRTAGALRLWRWLRPWPSRCSVLWRSQLWIWLFRLNLARLDLGDEGFSRFRGRSGRRLF